MGEISVGELPYFSISKTKQKHDPRNFEHRSHLQPGEIIRVHYIPSSRIFTVSLAQRKKNIVGAGSVSKIKTIIEKKIESWESAEILFCHPQGYKNSKKIQQLISRKDQDLNQYFLCLI